MLQSSLTRREKSNSNSISLRHGEIMLRFAFVALGIAAAIAAVAALAELAGFPAAGGAIGGAIGGVIAAMMIAGGGRKTCPRCAAELPQYRKPASLKQALWGGWTCPNCGCETDRQGRLLRAGNPLRPLPPSTRRMG
jgi:hypothetical protein